MSSTQSQEGSDFLDMLPRNRQHIIALAILFFIPLILFFQTTIGGQEILRHDITQWRAGAESIIEYREQYGEEPLWSSNMYSGMPSYVISMPKEVPNLDNLQGLFGAIYPAFQYWVMLFGMYFLLILMGFRPVSALFGSLVYGLTAYFPIIIFAGHTSKFFALAFIPWVLSGYCILSRSHKKWIGLFIFTVAYALEVRSGHPQITYYLMFLLAGLWGFDSYQYLFKEKNYQGWAILTGFLILGGVIGVLSHAERFLTLQEYAQYSIRGGSAISGTEALDPGYAFAWSQGIAETFTLLVPDLFGGASPDYWGPKSVTSGPHYFGILTIPFLLMALFRVRKPLMYVYFGVGVLTILFAWGENFRFFNQLAFDFIPLFDKFRAPETWLSLTAFCFGITAVYGFEWFLDFFQEKSQELKKIYVPLAGAFLLLAMAYIAVESTNYTRPGEIDRISVQLAQQNQMNPDNPQVRQRAAQIVNTQFIPDRQEQTKRDLLRAFLILIAGGALIFFIATARVPSLLGVMIFLGLFTFDMMQVDKRYMPEDKLIDGNIELDRYLNSQKRDIDTYLIDHIRPEGQNFPYRVFPLLDGAFSNNIPSYFYPTVGGYTGAKLSVTQDVLMADNNPLFSGPYGLNLDLLGLLNARYITYSQGLNIPGIEAVFQGREGVVYELQDVLPKAFFVDSVITTDDPVEAYNLLYAGQLDFSTTAIVEGYSPVVSTDSTSSLEITDYTGAEMTLQIQRSEPGFLVLSEIYYPEGWIAELNGEKIPIYKTNYLLRGMEIPAGEHTLRLDFKPRSHSLGITLSWLSLIAQILIGCLAAFTYFRSEEESE